MSAQALYFAKPISTISQSILNYSYDARDPYMMQPLSNSIQQRVVTKNNQQMPTEIIEWTIPMDMAAECAHALTSLFERVFEREKICI